MIAALRQKTQHIKKWSDTVFKCEWAESTFEEILKIGKLHFKPDQKSG